MTKAKSLEPEALYDFELFYWDPELLTKIKCPICKHSCLIVMDSTKYLGKVLALVNAFE